MRYLWPLTSWFKESTLSLLGLESSFMGLICPLESRAGKDKDLGLIRRMLAALLLLESRRSSLP